MQPDPVFLKRRSEQLLKSESAVMWRRNDRMFAVLLSLQWLGGIALASWSPHLWNGRISSLGIELLTAIILGAVIIAPPLVFVFRRPGQRVTRHVVAVSQMLSSGLLLHLSGGRPEMHFHAFGSLAFLALYRDWRVLVTASAVLISQQFGLSLLLPQSLYGAAAHVSRWRWLEQAAWVLFADIFLIYASVENQKDLLAIAERQAQLEDSQGSVERTVNERTAQVAQSNRDLGKQIGERQRIEQELRAARDELEARVRDRTAELGAANRALKRQIDEGRKTEEELARSMQRYRFVTDSVPQIVWTARPDGVLDYLNRRFHEYTGMTAEDSRKWGWKPAIHPDDLARYADTWQRAVESGHVFEMEVRFKRGQDGSYRWHLARALPMRDPDDQIVQWFGGATDIDDQKRSREVIKRSEQRYRSLVAASAQIVWLTDAECRVKSDLPEWRAATGQSYEEIIDYGWLSAIHPEDQERCTELWRFALETKTPYESEHRLMMADESVRHFSTRGVPVLEPDGRIREWIGTSTDITERQQAEEVLRRAHDELEARVRERTAQLTETNQILHEQVIERKRIEAELAEARDDALRSAKLKSQFLANMSHEIRTPMNGVIGMTSLLMDTPCNEEQREYVETIRASGDSLLSIINDILDFSKIEAGKLDFEQLDFDLQSTVESVVELLAEKAQAKGLDLACHVLEDVPRRLRGDPGRLRQVLVNLVGNAVKFTPKGRVLVHVAKLQETTSDTQICFQVSDTGIGLGEDATKELFQPFVQADGSMSRKFGGTGLGLAISKQLVELMGGQIGVESAPEQGSTFWFTVKLPKQPTLLAEDDLPADARERFSDVRALLVGAEGTCGVLQEQLISWGMQTSVLTNGAEALAALRTGLADAQPFGFVLVDANLSDMDGPTLARAIKSDPKLAALRIVLLLAPGQRTSAPDDANAHASLNKPVKRAQLRDFFESALKSPKAVRKAPQKAAVAARASKRGRIHVLIAEDNQVNQKVIIRQLQKIGYQADAVANGIEALEASGKVAYDVILMDCQMPEMDGFTATREIRHREIGTGMHTPIVALTANALEGDREKCLDSGMDDYMSKPVKIEALQAMLEQWAARNSQPHAVAA